jgi:hypothetical protein
MRSIRWGLAIGKNPVRPMIKKHCILRIETKARHNAGPDQ